MTQPNPITAAPSAHAFISIDAALLKFVAPPWAAVLVPLPAPLPIDALKDVLGGTEAVGEETVTPNADVGGTERIVPLPEAVAGVDPEGRVEDEVEEAREEVEDISGPMEKGAETANSLLMLPTSVARRV